MRRGSSLSDRPSVHVCVCRITVTRAKLKHRAIFTPGRGVDLLLRDFTALSAACGGTAAEDGRSAGGLPSPCVIDSDRKPLLSEKNVRTDNLNHL